MVNKRLIDADAFKMHLEEIRQDYLKEDTYSSNFAAEVIETVQDEYLAKAPTVDSVEVVHDRLFNLPRVSNRDYKDFVDGLEDYFKEAAFEDRSVGIFGMTEGETLLANALMEFLNGGTKMDGDGNG